MQGFNGKARILGLAIAAGMFGAQAHAGELQPLDEIPSVYDYGLTNSCAAYGDFIACSTAVLNFVAEALSIPDPNNPNKTLSFSLKADQGYIGKDDVIAVYTDGADAIKNPTVSGQIVMDNAYTTTAGDNSTGFSTNKTPSAAELYPYEADPNNPGPDPITGVIPADDPNTDGLNGNADDFAGDQNDYWDIQISALIKALTKGDLLRDPVFVFDNNQKGETDLPDLKLWGLIAVRDLINPTLANKEQVFEFRGCDADTAGVGSVSDPAGCDAQVPTVLDPNNNSTNPSTPLTFTTDKDFGDDPLLDQYAAVQRQFCVNTTTFNEVTCPTGGPKPADVEEFNQNLGTNEAEFFGFLPELTGKNLRKLLGLGYDTLSIDLRFFDQTNGFEDLFILAMNPESIPEPGTLALCGTAAIGFAATRRRKRAAAQG